MNREQLHSAAVRTLRAAVRHEHRPGETRNHLLALAEVLAEGSPLGHLVSAAGRIGRSREAVGAIDWARYG